MPHQRYHLYSGLEPDAPDHILGAETVARSRPAAGSTLGGGQAVLLKAFKQPWTPSLSDTQKETLRRFEHHGIVPFLRAESSLALGTCYAYYHYTVEPLTTAAARLRGRVGYQPESLAGQFEAVAEALHELSLHGIHHGAITPESIVFGATDGTLRIKDFGLTLRIGDDLNRHLPALAPAMPYIAPEFFDEALQGHDPLPTVASDIYGFGATLQFALTGDAPLPSPAVELGKEHERLNDDGADDGDDENATRAPSPAESILNCLRGDVARLDDWRHLPVLTAIVQRCLATDPVDRYENFAALADDLRRAATPLVARGTDAWGLRFADPRGYEVRVLPTCLRIDPDADRRAFGSQVTPIATTILRRPEWVIDTDDRTVVCTDVHGLEPLGARKVVPNVWEYHLANAFADLQSLGRNAPLIADVDQLYVQPQASRLYLLYPGVQPRAGHAVEFLQWAASLGRAPFAPELLQLAQRAADAAGHGADVGVGVEAPVNTNGNGQGNGQPAGSGQWGESGGPDIAPLSAPFIDRASLFAVALALYQALTGERVQGQVVRELPPAYMKIGSLSVAVSEILERCLRLSPAQRTAGASAAFAEYVQRQRDPGSRRLLARPTGMIAP